MVSCNLLIGLLISMTTRYWINGFTMRIKLKINIVSSSLSRDLLVLFELFRIIITITGVLRHEEKDLQRILFSSLYFSYV